MDKLNKKFNISFSWDLHYACNYRCPYCWFNKKWYNLATFNRYLSVKEWMKYWCNIYLNYGGVFIEISGGEPFIYPNFIQLIRELSILHTISIITNLSTDIKDFLNQIKPDKVKVTPTFHPIFAKLEPFIKKVSDLKDKGFTDTVSYLAYPSQIQHTDYYKERFDKVGLSFLITTFWGDYKGVTYPEGYTEEERKIIGSYLGMRAGQKYQLIPKKMSKGKLCHAGHRYALIKANGEVIRCGGSQLIERIGNFFEQDFKLLDKPLPCNADYCRCNEWAFLLEEDIPTTEKETSAVIFFEDHAKIKDTKAPHIKFPRLDSPYRVFWNWEITYECNYRCSYCRFWRIPKIEGLILSISEWNRIWELMFECYYTGVIRFSGGEPTIYPNFFDLLAMLLEMYTVDITTNLSFDVSLFLKKIKPGNISISSSFHPEYDEIEPFLSKIAILYHNGYLPTVSYVAYPLHLKKLDYFKSRIEEKGFIFKIIPFQGEFQGKTYPQSYTDSERNLLEDSIVNSLRPDINKRFFDWNVERQTQQKEKKGKLCKMGQMYARVLPDGRVTRCCADDSGNLGNISDDNFKLLDRPEPCEAARCLCFKSMLMGEEENTWLPLWEAPEHKKYKITSLIS